VSRDRLPDSDDRLERDEETSSPRPETIPVRRPDHAPDPSGREPQHRQSDDNQTRAVSGDSERTYYLQNRAYVLRESEFASLLEIGKFRVVDRADLAEFAYTRDTSRAERDLHRLALQGLVALKPSQDVKQDQGVVVLTRKGKRLLRKSGRVPEGQAIYQGLVKPRELKHDAAIYRLYQRETARIRQAGGTPLRVVLDYELKRDVYRKLAQLGSQGEAPAAREKVAMDHGLVLLHDKIQIPDLRIEYETGDHERRQKDLELATRNYRPRALAQKARAGFSIYAPREDASKLRRILDESELTARIFAL
jgi:hypothetical protein